MPAVMFKQKTNRQLGQFQDALAVRLKEHLKRSGKSIYQLSNDSGVDAAYIWRVLNSERHEVSREVLILLSLALIENERRVDMLVNVTNDLLDAAGYKSLRAKS